MKKIMFNDRYGLEQAVIAGTKTMTRRRIHFPGIDDEDVSKPVMGIDEKGRVYFTFDARTEDVDIYPKYQIGEQVAVAQSYENIPIKHFTNGIDDPMKRHFQEQLVKQAAAYKNKLFAVASLMPHVIRITNIKVERLQDISEEDAMREGVLKAPFDGYCVTGIGMTVPKSMARPIGHTADGKPVYGDRYRDFKFNSPREAFAALIDKISDRGTWNLNPWVFAYEFKLIK